MNIINNKDTLVFLTSKIPFPASSGRKTSLYHYCRILKKIGYRIIVVSIDDETNLNEKPEFIDEIFLLPKVSLKVKLTNLIWYSLIKNKFPMQVSIFFSKKNIEFIKNIINKYNPTVVIADMIRTTEYLKYISNDIYKIADLDDRISLRYSRQLDNDMENINPYGAFIDKMPKIIKKIMFFNFLKVKVMKKEIKLLNKYEIEIGKSVNKVIFVAQKECEQYNNQFGEEKSYAVPIGVDVNYFNYIESNQEKENLISFLGSLNVSHNENAVKNFVKNIFPLVKENLEDSKFIIIGGNASDELLELSNESIIFTGRVDDVREYLLRSKVFVCPLTFGSGIKTKNLEAMALGIPVVTTQIGAENIEAENNKDWYVASTNEEFAQKILTILQNKDIEKRFGKNGSDFIRNNFTWNIAEKKFIELLKEI